MKLPTIRSGMAQTSLGSIYYLISDGRMHSNVNPADSTSDALSNKPAILCFHMSPRSSDEFREVLPLLAASNDNEKNGHVVIAFDLPGYGSSDNPSHSCTMDEISDACLEAAESLLGSGKQQQYVAVGSLLGNYCCVSLAERYPERISAEILTNPWFNPEANGMTRSRDDSSPIPDSFVLKEDGSHLTSLHHKRSRRLDPELNFRVVRSEVEYLGNRRERYAKGIKIEGGDQYDFLSTILKIGMKRQSMDDPCKFLLIKGQACINLFDTIGLEGTKRFGEAYSLLSDTKTDSEIDSETDSSSDGSGVRVETLVGDKSTLMLVNQMPREFASLCKVFLSDHGL